MIFWAKYNTQTTFSFPMVKRGVVDLAVSADWTPAAADSAISKDQAAFADTTNTVAAVGGSPTRTATGWKITLTATELSAAQVDLQIVDAATKAVEDQFITIYTYGNASAKVAADWSDIVRMGLTGLANATPGAAGGLFIAGTNAATTITSAGGSALTLSSTGTNGSGLLVSGNGSGDGIKSTGGVTGHALELVGGGTSGDGLKITTTSGHGMNIAATGTSMHGITATGGNGGTSDGIKAVAGTGGVPIRGDITGNITGNLSGSAGSVTGAVGSVTGNVGGNVTGSVGSVVGAVGSVTGAVGSVTGAVGSVTGNVGGNVTGSVGSVVGAVGSVTGNVGGNVVGSVASVTAAVTLTAAYDLAKTASQAGDAMALTGGERTTLAGVINTTATVESYRANGAAPTPAQFMSEVLAHLGESSISGTTKTTHKLDHATTAQTFTLDSGTAPTSITRAT